MYKKITGFCLVLLTAYNVFAQQDSAAAPAYATVRNHVDSNTLVFKTLALRSRMLWDDGKSQQDFQGTVRIKADSAIWLSLALFGIEGARALLSPDTFCIINRLGSEYALRGFNAVEGWLYFPVSFNMLQQVMAGTVMDLPGQGVNAIAREDSLLVLYRETDKLLQKIWVDATSYTVSRLLLKDKMLQQEMDITFGAYNILNGKPFAYHRSIAIKRGPEKLRLDMDIQKAAVNEPVDLPFEIPARYTRVE